MRQNGFQQSGKPTIQIITPQRIHVGSTHTLGADQSGVTQNAKVVGHARLRAPTIEVPTAGFSHAREAADDLEAHRVAQGIEHTLQYEVINGRVFERSHERIIHRGLLCIHSSNIIEQLN